MRDRKVRPFNPLVLDPDDCEGLIDEDYVRLEDLEESDQEYEYLSSGSRRRRPQINSDF